MSRSALSGMGMGMAVRTVGVIIVNNEAGTPPNMAGDDPSIVIPAVSITQDAGVRIRGALAEVDPAGSLQFSSIAYSAGEGDGDRGLYKGLVERIGDRLKVTVGDESFEFLRYAPNQ